MRTADGYIISKCLNGDSAAFGLLVDKYKGSVYALAYSMLRNFHDAEDVTQEVFIKAYRKLRTLKQYDSFHAWLYAATSNLCKDWLKAFSRRPDNEFIEDKDPETLEAPYIDSYRESLFHESLYESLHEALDLMPETHSQVLTLRYLGGMNCKEIARFLGVSPTAIWQRLSRARAQLKEEMIAMININFERQKLRASFTLRIVDAIKRIRIQPMPRTATLPWGLSLATGIVFTILSLSPQPNMFSRAAIAYSRAFSSLWLCATESGTHKKILDDGRRVRPFAWSPDCKWLLCSDWDRKLWLLQLADGRELNITPPQEVGKILSWSPDGKWISYNSDGFAKIRPEGEIWEADFQKLLSSSHEN